MAASITRRPPAAESEAGTTDNGGLRSYGSMTYAGLKSMIFAGVKADDPRVKAAVKWIKTHYTSGRNPGMELHEPATPEAGLYYYLHTFAKALAALGHNEIVDDMGSSTTGGTICWSPWPNARLPTGRGSTPTRDSSKETRIS